MISGIGGPVLLRNFLAFAQETLPETCKDNEFYDSHTNFNLDLFLRISGFLLNSDLEAFENLSTIKTLKVFRHLFLMASIIYVLALSMVYTIPLYLEFRWIGLAGALLLTAILGVCVYRYFSSQRTEF